MALPPEPIRPGQIITAEWLNRVLANTTFVQNVKGRGYVDNQLSAFVTPRSKAEQTTWIGKPTESIVEGPLVGSARTINVWDGPANPSDAPTGETLDADYTTGDFAATDYVVVTKIGNYLYVSCFPSGTE